MGAFSGKKMRLSFAEQTHEHSAGMRMGTFSGEKLYWKYAEQTQEGSCLRSNTVVKQAFADKSVR